MGHPPRRHAACLGRVEYEIRDGEVVRGQRSARIMVTEAQLGRRPSPPCATSARRSIAVYGTDYGVHSPTWISRFTDMTRQAASYRERTRAAGRRRRARALPGRRAGPQHRRAGRGEPGLEAGPGGPRDVAGRACSTPTTPSATRSPPACCATRWRRSRCMRGDDRTEAAARRSSPSCWAWTSRASGSPR